MVRTRRPMRCRRSPLVSCGCGHWLCGLKMTNVPETWGGIESNPTSPLSVREKTNATSESRRRRSSTRCISVAWETLVLGMRMAYSRRSRSLSVGANLCPRDRNSTSEAIKREPPPPRRLRRASEAPARRAVSPRRKRQRSEGNGIELEAVPGLERPSYSAPTVTGAPRGRSGDLFRLWLPAGRSSETLRPAT